MNLDRWSIGPGDCWSWHGPRKEGHPIAYTNKSDWATVGKYVRVRPTLWETFTAREVLPKHRIDNVCGNDECVNPTHQQEVPKETSAHSTRQGAPNGPLCRKGFHPWPKEARSGGSGTFVCGACRLDRQRVWRAARG